MKCAVCKQDNCDRFPGGIVSCLTYKAAKLEKKLRAAAPSLFSTVDRGTGFREDSNGYFFHDCVWETRDSRTHDCNYCKKKIKAFQSHIYCRTCHKRTHEIVYCKEPFLEEGCDPGVMRTQLSWPDTQKQRVYPVPFKIGKFICEVRLLYVGGRGTRSCLDKLCCFGSVTKILLYFRANVCT